MGEVVWFSTLLILMISCHGFGAFVEGGREAALPGGDDQKNDQNITPVISQQLLNSFHLLIVKASNDMENRMEDKLAQLQNIVNDKISLLDSKTKSELSQFQNGLNGKINTLDTKTNSQLSQLQNILKNKLDTLDTKSENRLAQNFQNVYDKFDALENRMEVRFKSTDEKLIYLQVHLNTIKNSIDPKKDDKLGHLYGNLTNESDTCQKKADVKLQTLQNNVDARIGTLENYINDELDTLGERLEDKLDKNSLQLNDKISQKLVNYSTDSKTDIINSLESLMQKSQEEQKTTLGNFSEDVDMNMNKTLHFLARIESSFEACKKTDEIFDYKNQTRKVLDVLTSINSTQSQHFQAPSRRTKGGVDFYKNWAAYKKGFGKPLCDFWLGNEAIYQVTDNDAYELRIDLNDGIQDLFAVYSSFKLTSEVDNYRLLLGSHSGTLGEDSTQTGLSSHDGMQFSTYDRDNDGIGGNCAEAYHGAWWYNDCYTSHLNGLWGVKTYKGLMWNTGSVGYFAKST